VKLIMKTLIAGVVMSAGIAYAEVEPTDPVVIARQDLMKTIGMNTKVLGDMAGGKADFDAAKAEAAKAALIAASADIGAKFETQSTDPGEEAKPEVWTNWEDFLKKAGALNAAATALDASSLDTIKAGMGGIGGACKDCHTSYRM
jgi:cytochrome c556